MSGLNLGLLLLSIILTGNIAFAKENFYGMVYDKYDSKKKVGWSLADWMSQKSKVDAQDLWLSMNRKSNFFELYLAGGQGAYSLEEDSVQTSILDESSTNYKVGAFVTMFGVEHEVYEQTTDFKLEETQGSLMLFGQSLQSTNIVLFGGVSKRTESRLNLVDVSFNYWGASFDLYLLSFFGFSVKYKKYMESDFSAAQSGGGTNNEFGAFVELGPLRLLLQQFVEEWNWQLSQPVKQSKRYGSKASLQIIF